LNIFSKKTSETDTVDSADLRLKKVERKLSLLIGVSICQCVLLAVIAVGYFLPSTFTLVLFAALAILFVFVFHKQIPGWIGNLSRYVFAQMIDSQKSDSMKGG
jgi:Flp pilus assembly protein TadB